MRVNNNTLIFSVLFISVHANTNSLHISHEGKKNPSFFKFFFFNFPKIIIWTRTVNCLQRNSEIKHQESGIMEIQPQVGKTMTDSEVFSTFSDC